MRTGSDWFAETNDSDSSIEEDARNQSKSESSESEQGPAVCWNPESCPIRKSESSSSDEATPVLPAGLEVKTLALVKSRVDRLRSDFSLVNERLDRMRLMQQIIMRAVVDQGVTSKTNRAYNVIYVTGDKLGDNRRDIARLEGLTLMGFLTAHRDTLAQTKVYPMGIGCEERKYETGEITLDYSSEGQDHSMTAALARDPYGDHYLDFTDSVWPSEDLEKIEFCFNLALELQE